jgi:hypothetical protein
MFHELFYIVDPGNKTERVEVEIYSPATSLPGTKEPDEVSIKYNYRFQVPDSKSYNVSYCEMSRKNIKTIKWNLIDSYICIQGKLLKFFFFVKIKLTVVYFETKMR